MLVVLLCYIIVALPFVVGDKVVFKETFDTGTGNWNVFQIAKNVAGEIASVHNVDGQLKMKAKASCGDASLDGAAVQLNYNMPIHLAAGAYDFLAEISVAKGTNQNCNLIAGGAVAILVDGSWNGFKNLQVQTCKSKKVRDIVVKGDANLNVDQDISLGILVNAGDCFIAVARLKSVQIVKTA